MCVCVLSRVIVSQEEGERIVTDDQKQIYSGTEKARGCGAIKVSFKNKVDYFQTALKRSFSLKDKIL